MAYKIVDASQLDGYLTDIANAIRTKAGTSGTLSFPTGFTTAIQNIPSGGGGDIDKLIDGTITEINCNATSIRPYALSGISLRQATFPLCSLIGSSAFYRCTALTTVSFPLCITIGPYAFASCGSLTNVFFPKVSTIDAYAFSGVSRLTTASFPLCTKIAMGAFYRCSTLATISFPICSMIDTYAFSSCSLLTSIFFPQASFIGASAFYGCNLLVNASFPKCISIGASVFFRCFNLLSLYLLGSSVPTLVSSTAFNSTPIGGYTVSTGGIYGNIIVKSEMLSLFLADSIWKLFSSRFSIWNGTD